jgi:hypothetical protein
VAEPLPGSPMIVFVNCKSGGGHGERFLRRFKQILNPGQVFDIANEGPTFGLEVYRYLAPLHLLVCGGDGSVGWVLKEIDQLQLRVWVFFAFYSWIISYSSVLIGCRISNLASNFECLFTFCYSAWANLLDTKLLSCKLQTGQSISYKYVNQF